MSSIPKLWNVAGQVAHLQRDTEYILFNAAQVNPAWFERGGAEVLALLERLRAGQPFFEHEVCSQGLSAELFSFLAHHHLIVPLAHEADSTSTHRCRCRFMQDKPVQKSLYLLLTHNCNQSCIYCYNGRQTYLGQPQRMMSREVAFRAIEQQLASLAGGGRLEIVFFGGEPLLNWPLARDILRHCEQVLKPRFPDKTLSSHFTTNLTLLPDDLIPMARDHGATFLVDVDGPADVHNRTRPFRDGTGSLATTVKHIGALAKAGLEVALRATVTRFNQDRMVEVTRLHRELGGNSSAFVPLNAVDSDGRIFTYDWCPEPQRYARGLRAIYHSGIWPLERLFPFNEFAGRLRPGYQNLHACGAPHGNTPVVTADGQIFSCIYLVNIPKFKLGHCFDEGPADRQVIEGMKEVVNINHRPTCSCCNLRHLCGGGCPVGLFSIADNPDAPPHVKVYTEKIACATARTVLEELMWDLPSRVDSGTE